MRMPIKPKCCCAVLKIAMMITSGTSHVKRLRVLLKSGEESKKPVSLRKIRVKKLRKSPDAILQPRCMALTIVRRYALCADTAMMYWRKVLWGRIYYKFSPKLIKYFGQTRCFNAFWHGVLDKWVQHLQDKGFKGTPYQDRNIEQ